MNTELLTYSEEICTLEKEIIELKNKTASNIIQIGNKLIEAKSKLKHGEWGNWLEDRVSFSQRTANNMMRMAQEFSNSQAISNLESTKLLLLLDLPTEIREGFMDNNDIKNMSTREIKSKIKTLNRDLVYDTVFDDKIYEIEISKLKPFPDNTEYFPDMKGKDWVDFLESINRCGVIIPIIITRDNLIISGHQRVRACKDLGIDKIPAGYFYSKNNNNYPLDKLLLSAYISSNLNTRSCIFYLALAWNALFFGNPEDAKKYLDKFVNYDDGTYNVDIDKFNKKCKQID